MILNDMVPAGGKRICATTEGACYAVTSAFFCNTSEDAVDILDVYLVASKQGVAMQSKIVCRMQIMPTDTFVLDHECIVLEDGDYLYASSQSGNISAVLSVMNLH